MAKSSANETGTLWEQLPKQEQERIKRELADKGKEPVKNAKQAKASTFSLKGYLRCELSSADKEGFRSWESEHSAEEAFTLLIKAVDSGYLLKIGQAGGGFQATFSAADTGLDWDGYVLTAHAGGAQRAALLLVYKHCILMQEDWGPWMQEGGEDALR